MVECSKPRMHRFSQATNFCVDACSVFDRPQVRYKRTGHALQLLEASSTWRQRQRMSKPRNVVQHPSIDFWMWEISEQKVNYTCVYSEIYLFTCIYIYAYICIRINTYAYNYTYTYHADLPASILLLQHLNSVAALRPSKLVLPELPRGDCSWWSVHEM